MDISPKVYQCFWKSNFLDGIGYLVNWLLVYLNLIIRHSASTFSLVQPLTGLAVHYISNLPGFAPEVIIVEALAGFKM